MKIAVVGGALQGLEVAYLARKAGMETVLLDRRSAVPAAGLCDVFRQVDATDHDALDGVMAGVDLIFPALESRKALSRLHTWAHRRGLPIVHDPEAYAVSSSKLASERFFRRLGIPVPAAWPDCPFPVIVKPSDGSGSQGIQVFTSPEALRDAVGQDPPAQGWVVQALLPGPTYSIEVIRSRGNAIAVQITDLHMDATYDCKRVTAPSALSTASQARLIDMSLRLADGLDLAGIMDVEAVLHDGALKVLEIDARFPSQTPITVYWSSGINMAEVLANDALNRPSATLSDRQGPDRGVVFEHIRVAPGVMTVTGEHAMTTASSLSVKKDFLGADEAITDYAEGKDRWVATLICSGRDMEEAWARRNASVAAMRRRFNIECYEDPSPSPVVRKGRI